MQKFLTYAGVVALALGTTCVHAHVIDKGSNPSTFKLRADVAQQEAKYTACLVKAASKCEKGGAFSGPECDLATGAVSYEPTPGADTTKFQNAIAKCDTKLELTKRGTDYAGIGCPGDCDVASGLQQCASLAAYESAVEGSAATAAKSRIGLLAVAVDDACAAAGTPDSEARIDCVADAMKQLAKYASSLFKCEQKCEGDEKGKKGGGALTNAAVCLVGPDAHASLVECEEKAAAKVTSTAAVSASPQVVGFVNESTDGLFNREAADDPASPAGTLSPCGTCGNGSREGTEECDGASLGACEACAPDCSCTPAVCGNGVIEGTEDCDGAALGACTAGCESDCTCTPDLDDPILDGPAGTFCSSTFNPATIDYQPLCVPTEGRGQHFRVEGAQVFADNSFFYLALGFPASPSGNPSTSVGDGRFIFTGGKSVSCTFGWSYFRYSGITDPPAASLCTTEIFGDYTDGPQEACLDVSDHTAPNVTFWATGQNGANCKDRTTLTLATALYTKSDWPSANNQPINDLVDYMKVNSTAGATLQTVRVSSRTVLDYGPVDPVLDGPVGSFCTTTVNPSTDAYQQLCVPTESSGRHFRLEGAQTFGENGFFYLAMGFPSAPTGNPATTVGDGRFIFTGGKSVSCTFGWSYFRYSGITHPASLCATEIFGDYTAGPQEVCLDVTGDTPPRVTFWATGKEGADCKDRRTLTAASALLSKDDWASANNQPVATTTHFAKISNTLLATLTSVGVSSRLVLD